MKRVFEIELNVPDDFDATYNQPYQFGGRCSIRDGNLAWSVYADAKVPTSQWRVARASDEGTQARFRDNGRSGWSEGKLLHVDSAKDGTVFLALINGSTSTEWFDFCEVQV
jgi:hypothetical protein